MNLFPASRNKRSKLRSIARLGGFCGWGLGRAVGMLLSRAGMPLYIILYGQWFQPQLLRCGA
jgi:hypothetical protein